MDNKVAKFKNIFNQAKEKLTAPCIKILSQGDETLGGLITYQLLNARNNPVEFKKLLEQGHAEVSNISAVFHRSWRDNYVEIVDIILTSCSDLVKPDLNILLKEYLRFGSKPLEMAKVLIKHGAKAVDLVNGPNGYTEKKSSIHEAAACGDTALLELLISHGADAKMKSSEGYDALCYAVGKYYHWSNSAVKTIKFLIEAGSDIHANNDYVLRMSIQDGDTEAVTYLLNAGANKNLIDTKGRNIVKMAEDCLEFIRQNSNYFGSNFIQAEYAYIKTLETVKTALLPPKPISPIPKNI